MSHITSIDFSSLINFINFTNELMVLSLGLLVLVLLFEAMYLDIISTNPLASPGCAPQWDLGLIEPKAEIEPEYNWDMELSMDLVDFNVFITDLDFVDEQGIPEDTGELVPEEESILVVITEDDLYGIPACFEDFVDEIIKSYENMVADGVANDSDWPMVEKLVQSAVDRMGLDMQDVQDAGLFLMAA